MSRILHTVQTLVGSRSTYQSIPRQTGLNVSGGRDISEKVSEMGVNMKLTLLTMCMSCSAPSMNWVCWGDSCVCEDIAYLVRNTKQILSQVLCQHLHHQHLTPSHTWNIIIYIYITYMYKKEKRKNLYIFFVYFNFWFLC